MEAPRYGTWQNTESSASQKASTDTPMELETLAAPPAEEPGDESSYESNDSPKSGGSSDTDSDGQEILTPGPETLNRQHQGQPSKAVGGESSPFEEDYEMLDEDPEPKSRDVADTLREDAPLLSRSEACFTESMAADLIGFKGPTSIKVVFHVIIPKHLWEWDESSFVFVRFGCENLGGWSQNIGTFSSCRDIGEAYCEMTSCVLWLNTEVLKEAIPYKYVIFTPKTRSTTSKFVESLGKGTLNRALNLSRRYQQTLQEGTYHQYDTMALPEDWSGSAVKSMFTRWQDKPLQLKTPSNSLEVKQISFELYLESSHANFVFDEAKAIEKYVERVYHIFICIAKRFTTSSDKPVLAVNTQNITKQTKKWFGLWLLQILKMVRVQPAEKQLLVGVWSLWCLKKLGIPWDNQEVKMLSSTLLKLLCAQEQGDKEQKQWKEYDKLCCFLLDKEHREMIAEATRNLSLVSAAARHGVLEMDWMFGIPLYSFLTDRFTPFEGICNKGDVSLTSLWSLLRVKFNLKKARKKFRDESRFVEQYMDKKLKFPLRLDPLTLLACVYICPEADLHELFHIIPPNVSITWLSYMLSQKNPEFDHKDCKIHEISFWETCTKGIKFSITSDKFSSALDLSVFETSAKNLLQRATLYIRAPLKDTVRIVFAAASLVCTTLQYIHRDPDKFFANALAKLEPVMRDWVKKAIGVKMFGYDQTALMRSKRVFSKGADEMEVWKTLLSLGSSDQHEPLWIEIVCTLFSERVKKVPDSLLVQLLLFVEQKENDLLIKQVLPYIAKAADYFLSIQCPYKLLESLEDVCREDSKIVGNVLDKILKKKYPEIDVKELECDWVTLEVILDWTVWPCYLQLLTSDPGCPSLLLKGLSEQSKQVCRAAMAQVKMLFFHLQSDRMLTLKDLNGLITNREQVEILCKSIEKEKFAYSSISQSLDEGADLLQFLDKHMKAYRAICDQFQDSSRVEGLTLLKKELSQDVESKTICDLFQFKDKTFVLKCFEHARPFDIFVDHITIMKQSELFMIFLGQQIKRVLDSRSRLAIADIYTEIWQPTFEECQGLLNSIIDQSIKLSLVDTLIKDYFPDVEKFKEAINILAKVVHSCLNEPMDENLLQKPFESICEYWKLCNNQIGAKLLLQLREMLKLEGSFELVEKFSSQLTHSLKEEPLKSIELDGDLKLVGRFLDDITNDDKKRECLKTFMDCRDIINWLKDNTKSVNDIQRFVTVALATAAGGEGDLAHDRLSHLRTVGSGFASLIFQVKETDGVKQLMDGCKSLWKALEKDANLPTFLLNCNRHLQWYKSVSDTQGPVEKTSFGQMTNILKYGTYRVDFKGDAQTVHDLVSVVLHQQDQLKGKYTLDELRDLESRLVLICGSEAKSRAEVDHYLNLLYSATRIAELYLNLQRAGDVTYSTACLYFRCALYDEEFNKDVAERKVIVLHDYTQKLSEQLVLWNKKVDTAREKYYELNYFTTLQLLKLRREFGHLIQPTTAPLSLEPSVLMLLKSVSPSITDGIVSQAMQALSVESAEASVSKKKHSTCTESSVGSETAHTTSPTSMTHYASPLSSSPADGTLTFDKLDKKQKYICSNIMHLGFSKSLVLRAFHSCGLGANPYQLETWCEENEDLQGDDEDGDDEQEDEIIYESLEPGAEDADTDNSDDDLLLHLPANDTLPGDHQSYSSSPGIRTVVRETVDEAHPSVRELLKLGYDLGDSLMAVSKYRDTHKAKKYLDNKDSEQEAEEFVSREDVMEDVEVDEILEYHDGDPNKDHLELEHLGRVLETITKEVQGLGAMKVQRTFGTNFKTGLPNLLVTPSDNVLSCVLGLYASDIDLPLPTPEEVLLCTSTTTTEEVSLLWRRAIDDPGFKRIFCLAHAEKLPYQVCDAALRSFSKLSQGRKGYRLVVVCSKGEERKSLIISRLHTFKRTQCTLKESHYRDYLKKHFLSARLSSGPHNTSEVDPNKSSVLLVSSTQSGMGKSLYIKRRADELIQATMNQYMQVTIPIHGPPVTNESLLDFFIQHRTRSTCKLYHLDIAPRVLKEVDCHLFSLLILKGLSDNRGNVWRCQPTQIYMVEVTLPAISEVDGEGLQTLKLLKLLPTVKCVSPRDVINQQKKKISDTVLGMDEIVLRSPEFQKVYEYLSGYNKSSFLRKSSINLNANSFINLILSHCSVCDPSWAEIYHFTKFLDIQLRSSENSVFCNEKAVGGLLPGLQEFVVKFMIRMSQDFSTPSLSSEFSLKNENDGVKADNNLSQYRIEHRRQWEQSSHPYIFFNNDRVSITFVGFKVNAVGELIDPETNVEIEPGILKPKLYDGLVANGVDFKEDYHSWDKKTMIQKLTTVMECEYSSTYDPDPTYVFTLDNLIKMLAILMRFRCDIPVVIMGETGCGKTRLIRYMCDLARQERQLRNMLILKIYGGITDKDIISFVEDAEREAKENKAHVPKVDTVVFFDEANTTESIGLIKEIMCDRRMNGRAVSGDLKFIAACNPYRKHSEEMIQKLETAGLGFFNHPRERLGNIPLRQLVYRVLEIPPSMRPLIYDFGQLSTNTEYSYTLQIVSDHINRHPQLGKYGSDLSCAIARVLNDSQKFMRAQTNECSFVSLRDVERAMIVFEYFFEKMQDVFAQLIDKRANEEYLDAWLEVDDVMDKNGEHAAVPVPVDEHYLTTAMILTLSVCYHARLQERADYEELVSASFTSPLNLSGGAQQFRNEIKWCQEGLLGHMEVGGKIAKNAALRENVFMMVVCIELRIPLFLVGKPGSSKSLAKSIIQDSMHGQGSQSPLLRNFKQVHMFSYQCSQLSTPESIIDLFKSAERFQLNQDIKQYVSVVVLDEVGLAEDSPTLPLKALHPLLEDGTAGSGKNHQYQAVERDMRVAFVGISNWALDPAKMNRGVMVTRREPGQQELEFSANDICSTESDDPIREQLLKYFKPLSQAYIAICQKQERQFYGLRDFYSLIKMLYWMSYKSKPHPLTMAQLEHAIKRNFSGLESTNLNPLEEFQKAIGSMFGNQDLSAVTDDEHSKELRSILNPDCTSQGLIKASLNPRDTTWHGENRYLLFLTENYAALNILKHFLSINSSKMGSEDLASQPYVLFGSSFPKDNDYTQICRNINQIKICMETGRTIILLNLENLYASLYDVLNQYYMYFGGARYVDLGLQANKVKCRVHQDFKLILIAEKDIVYKKFPTPLINRLEKHFVLTSTVLEEWQCKALEDFKKWIKDFSQTIARDSSGNKFEEAHAFVGYQKDTPAAVIFQATLKLQKMIKGELANEAVQLQRSGIFNSDFLRTSDLSTLKNSPQWSEAVFRLSKFLLLQTAADDAVIRLRKSNLSEVEVKNCLSLYYEYQHHGSLSEFLQHECTRGHEVFMQVTTHSPLMSQNELIATISGALSIDFACFNLHEFDTSVDFTNKIGPIFNRKEDKMKPFLVIIQCDSGHLSNDLIACARYRVYDEAIKPKIKNDTGGRHGTHVVFIVRIPQQEVKSHFVGFEGEPWICTHIDELRATTEFTILPQQADSAKISELFLGKRTQSERGLQPRKEIAGPKEVNKGERKPSTVKPKSMKSNAIMEKSETLEKQSAAENEDQHPEDMFELPSKNIVYKIESSTHSTPSTVQSAQEFPSLVSENDTEKIDQCAYMCEKVRDSEPLHAQHRRLRGCIQAAVSMLSDSKEDRSMQRIQILLHLIPDTPKDQLDEDSDSFYTLLVNFIYLALRQRESSVKEENWALIEASSSRKLQNGGTFRNVLARHIDEVITSYFAKVIAHIDQNCNLDLLYAESQINSGLISEFWLSMFNLSSTMIDFCVVPSRNLAVMMDFHCKFPFSWLVKEMIEAATCTEAYRPPAQGNKLHLDQQMVMCVQCLKTSKPELENLLSQKPKEEIKLLYGLYLHDFVRYNYKSTHRDELQEMEHQLIMDALDNMTKDLSSEESLLHKMVALHLVYKRCCSELYQFRQLVQHRPGILQDKNLLTDDNHEFTLHLYAVQRVLDSDQEEDLLGPRNTALIGLTPPIKSDNQAEVTLSIHRWLNHVRMSQNIIDTILRSNNETEVACKARKMWQRVRASQIFAEKVYIPHSEVQGMLFVIRRLDYNLNMHSNFLEIKTLEAIKKFLNRVPKMKKQLKVDDSMRQEFTKHCNDFFIEIVSRLCFGGKETPEVAVLSSLFDIVLHVAEGTEPVASSVKFFDTPAVKSFLLQLLLEHTFNQVEECLSMYFNRPIKEVEGHPDYELCLLCIHCFEDTYSKKVNCLQSDRRIHAVVGNLDKVLPFLCQDSQAEVTLKYLQSVADARFSLFVASEQLMNEQFDCRVIKKFCVDPTVAVFSQSEKKDIISGPLLYLIKVLVRKLGFPCLNTVSKRHPWTVPTELIGTMEEILSIDPFVIYEEQYMNVRDLVSTAINDTEKTYMEELEACIRGVYRQCFMAFAIYQKVTSARASIFPHKHVPIEVLHTFNTFIEEFSWFSDDMRHMMRLLLVNQQGGNLAQLTVSPDQPALCRILGSVIVHTVAVILSVTTALELLLPFARILVKDVNSEEFALLNVYLPTMPEDQLLEVKKAGSVFLDCPNGHPFFVGAHGMKKGVCGECGALMSGVSQLKQWHTLNDTTKTGYDLGDPNQRSLNPERVRDLSAPAVCIIRAIMHSVFVWATSRQNQLLSIAEIMNSKVPPENLPEFFWMHLEKDIKCLMQCLGRGVDECAIVIHLVLQQIMLRMKVRENSTTTHEIDRIKHLKSKDARRKWEQLFYKFFIDPVLSDLDASITSALDRIITNEQDNKHLLQLVFKNVDDHRLQAHLWDIQPRISLEDLKRRVQADGADSVRALDAFLQAEPSLRATQYLPDIVKLQKFLFGMYDKHVMKGEAKVNTVEDFLNKVEQKFNENTRKECQAMIGSLRCAWLHVRHNLRNHSNNRLVVEEKHLLTTFSLETPLIYLLPTTTGEGKCTTALVDYLVLTHNDFIEKCRGIVTEGAESAAVVWREYKVPIAHIHHCHMLEYELHIQSIILSHCHYSFDKRGHWEIEYDLPALGKHILNQFVYGKPTILLDIPNIAFRKEVYTMETFMEIRHKVNPQVPLDQPIQQDILTELKTPEKLRESLDVVEIVIGLLCSKEGKTKASTSLKGYIDFHRMTKKPFSVKAKQHCTLGHIISLWETISVELARLYWERGQEPFESIPRGYMTNLEDGQKKELDKHYGTFDLGPLLGALFQFIEVHVKQITTDESANDGLVQSLDRYWKMTEQKPIDLKTFPNCITVSQAVAAWKHIAGCEISIQ